MARFYPEQFPEFDDAHVNERRGGERSIFEALKRRLKGPYRVFYSVQWLARTRDSQGPRDGEADFVIVHPEMGFLVIEAKGGGIRREGGKWISIDGRRNRHVIKDPYEQAMTAKYALIKKIKSLPAWQGRWIDAGHGVIFPDCARPPHSLGADAPDEITGFSEDLREIDVVVKRMFDYWQREDSKRRGSADREDLDALCDILAPTFELEAPTPTLIATLEARDRQILQLTQEQYRVLDYLSRTRRVLVTGAAGTGKTMLALEKARRLSREGFETLLVCSSRLLAHFFESETKKNSVTVLSVEELADYESGKDFAGFDALVVDEGSELNESQWQRCFALLGDADQDIVYVFADSNFLKPDALDDHLKDLVPITLDENLRNSTEIFELSSRFYSGDRLKSAGASTDHEIVYIESEPGKLMHALEKELRKRTRQESVPYREIAVLSGAQDSEDSPVLKHGRDGFIGDIPVKFDPFQDKDAVTLATIHEFRGLEAPVVILCEIDEALKDDSDKAAALIYTGATRARTLLVIIAGESTLQRVQRGF